MKKLSISVLFTLCFLTCLFVSQPPASGFDLSGKKVNIIVPFKEGGGTDTYARLYAPFLKKYLPGHPTVLVRNVPGGGSVKGANKFQKAKPDGLTAMGISSSTYANYSLSKGSPKIKFDVLSWNPIVLNSTGLMFFVNASTGAKGNDQIEDFKLLLNTHLVTGVSSPTSVTMSTTSAFKLLGKKLKVIFGLSTSKRRQAFLRGEVNIGGANMLRYHTNLKPYAKDGTVIPIATYGVGRPDGTVVRDPNYPNMLTFNEIVEKLTGDKPSGPGFDAYTNYFYMITAATKALVLPKGTSQEIMDVWIEAVRACYADPEFMEKVKPAYGNYPVYIGEDAEKIIKIACDMKPETRTWIKNWIKEDYNIDI